MLGFCRRPERAAVSQHWLWAGSVPDVPSVAPRHSSCTLTGRRWELWGVSGWFPSAWCISSWRWWPKGCYTSSTSSTGDSSSPGSPHTGQVGCTSVGGSTSLLHWDLLLLLGWGSWWSLSLQARRLETPGLWGWIQVFLFPLKLFLEMPQRGSLDWCLQREQRWGFTFCEGTGGPSTVLSLGVATPWLNKAPGWCWQGPV